MSFIYNSDTKQFLLFGYDQGLFGGILGGERFKDMLGNPGPTMSGLVTAIYDIGCAFGAVAAFIWGEKIGRKNSIILANILVIIGATVQTASFSYWQMFVSRIIGGLGVGLSTVAVPILQSETLPAHNRGALLVVQSALIIIGVAIASWLCFATLYANSSLQWRFPVACQILFSMLVLGCCPFICETPRWLAKHGRKQEAAHVIARILDKPDDDEEVQGQLTEILENIAAEHTEEEPTWGEVFSNATRSRNLQRVLLGMGPYMMNQWSGINALVRTTDDCDDYANLYSATISPTFCNSTSTTLNPWHSFLRPAPLPNMPSSLGHHTFTSTKLVVAGLSCSHRPAAPSAWPSLPVVCFARSTRWPLPLLLSCSSTSIASHWVSCLSVGRIVLRSNLSV